MCIHASHTSFSMKREPSFGPQLTGCALVFNVQLMLSVWCYVHVPHVTEARLGLWHAHLVCLDCSSAVPACCCGTTEFPIPPRRGRGELEMMLPPLASQQEWKHLWWSSTCVRLQVLPGQIHLVLLADWLVPALTVAMPAGSHGNSGSACIVHTHVQTGTFSDFRLTQTCCCFFSFHYITRISLTLSPPPPILAKANILLALA